MSDTDEVLSTKKPSFKLPDIMDILRKKNTDTRVPDKSTGSAELLPKEVDCCDAATD